MKDLRMAVGGIGATGAVLAAAPLKKDPDVLLVDPRPGLGEAIKTNGIRISGQLTYNSPACNFFERIEILKTFDPNLIFLSTKTQHLPLVLNELKEVVKPGTKIVSTHNRLGTENMVAQFLGADAAFRMSLNHGVSLRGPCEVGTAFFNRPNHLGSVTKENKELGSRIAMLFTNSGLDTECVDDIKLYVWKKMIMKCTMASICAITDKTLWEVLAFPPTREIADNCVKEILAVAKAKGYDLATNMFVRLWAILSAQALIKIPCVTTLPTRPLLKSISWAEKSLSTHGNRELPFRTTLQ